MRGRWIKGGTLAAALSLLAGTSGAQPIEDLPPGWTLDKTYLDYGNIRYVAPDAKFRVDISNDEATDRSAAEWLTAYLDKQAERYTVVDRAEPAPAYDMIGTLGDEADAATAPFSFRYKDGPVKRSIVTAIVRPGEPVTLVTVDGMTGMPSRDELAMASELAARTVVQTAPGQAVRTIKERASAPVPEGTPQAAFRGIVDGAMDCDEGLAVIEGSTAEADKVRLQTAKMICDERAKDAAGGDRSGHDHAGHDHPVSPEVAALPASGPERKAAIREMARKAAREKYGRKDAAPSSQTDANFAASPKGDGHVGVVEVVHQSRDTYSGDFLDVEHHVYFLYEDGTAIRSPNIAIIDVGKDISREKWPEGWFEWRRKDGKLQVRSTKRPEWWTPGGSLTTLSPSEAGLRLDGRYKYARTSGSMVFGSSVVFRTYKFTADGRYEQSSASMVGGGADLGAGPGALGASSCDKDGQRSAVVTGNPNAPGASSRGTGCGKANEGRYHIDGYAITLAADNGRVYRLPFYRPYDSLLLIGGYWYGEQKG